MFELISEFINTQKMLLCETNQRMAVVFHADENQPSLSVLMKDLNYNRRLVVSSLVENALAPEQATTQLGEEYDCVVFDARLNFNPNALAAVAGVLCGGGCLLVILPELNKWKNNPSLFLRHVDCCLRHQTGVYYFKQAAIKSVFQSPTKLEIKTTPAITASSLSALHPYRTEDQKQVVNTVLSDLQTNQAYCGVLTAARGRGKTSALGFIAGKLLIKNNIKLLVSAPKLSIIDPLFQHVNQYCRAQGVVDLVLKKSGITIDAASINFIAPDLLLQTLPEADVLFVDEAAAIPLFMLEQLLTHYTKIIFSTTTHGYEGTGRGFALKFCKHLDKIKLDWKKLTLHQPIRWSSADPLESWVESLLFLNLKPQDTAELSVDNKNDFSKARVSLLNRSHLLQDKEKLITIFSLLIFSHYRTSPSDFQTILDSADIRLYALQYKGKLLGVVVINQEGGFDGLLSKAIYQGKRRPRGHLLPQTLCFHGGCEGAAKLTYARIMRIAVLPEYQRQGFGHFLLDQVIANERETGVDMIGSSFSATPSLLRFWQYSDLQLLRIGFSQDHVTASHAVVLGKALTDAGEAVVRDLRLRFYQHIMLWLQGPLAGLSVDLKALVISALPKPLPQVSVTVDRDDVVSFANFSRNYDACMPAITRFIKHEQVLSQTVLAGLSEVDKRILELSRVYINDWAVIVKKMQLSQHKVSGKKQAQKLLRAALRQLLAVIPKTL